MQLKEITIYPWMLEKTKASTDTWILAVIKEFETRDDNFSINELADFLNVNRSTIIRTIKKLERDKLIKITREKSKKNKYKTIR